MFDLHNVGVKKENQFLKNQNLVNKAMALELGQLSPTVWHYYAMNKPNDSI